MSSTYRTDLADLVANDRGLDEHARARALFDLYWANTMAEFPERATMFGWPGHDARWTDWSIAGAEARDRDDAAMLDALRGTDPSQLHADDVLSRELLIRQLEVRLAGQRFPSHLMPITKMARPYVTMARAIENIPRTASGFDDAVTRLRSVKELVDQLVDTLRAGVEAGITPPRFTIDDTPAQLHAAANSERSPILAPLLGTPAERSARDIFDAAVAPALARFAVYLEDEYLPACRTSTAWSELPDGADWYRYLVRQHTTTDLEPTAIHELGIEQVAAIRAEMETVVASTGHTGSFDEFTERLRTGDEFYFTDPDALLSRYRDICKRIDPELPRLFGTLPRLPYGVREIPELEAPTTTTAYYLPGSPASGRPGWFMANTYDLRSRPTWEMEALTVHEAVPGHHLQIALAAELDDVPAFRTGWAAYTAFVEGWGLYSERLGHDIGLYTDPYSRFGALTYQMWRAVRLVIDTGLHAFGWSREQAIEYFASNSSKPLHDITVEVDRYIGWPGQALAYKIGELAISNLRAEAEAALGTAFDIRTFHDIVLGAGALPLDVLETRVRSWLSSEGRAPA